MPFRERLKRAFTRTSSSNSNSSSHSPSNATETSSSTRRNSNVYQPGEKMPPLKYRRPVEKAHKEKLESFSWAKAWRRRSGASQYSPMGSRMPSRGNSVVSMAPARKSGLYRRSLAVDGDGSVLSRKTTHSISEVPEPSDSASPSASATNRTSAQPGWTQEDLALALKRSRLDVPPP